MIGGDVSSSALVLSGPAARLGMGGTWLKLTMVGNSSVRNRGITRGKARLKVMNQIVD